MHFGIGEVPKAPTATRFKPILMFFTIFLGWPIAAGAFFFVSKTRLSAVLPQALFFNVKDNIFDQK